MAKKGTTRDTERISDTTLFVVIVVVLLLIAIIMFQPSKTNSINTELSLINCRECDNFLSTELARLKDAIREVGNAPVNSTKAFTLTLDDCAEGFDVTPLPSCPFNCSDAHPVCWAIVAAGDCPRSSLMYKGCSGKSGGIEIAPKPEVPCNFTKNMTLLIKKAGPNAIEIIEA